MTESAVRGTCVVGGCWVVRGCSSVTLPHSLCHSDCRCASLVSHKIAFPISGGWALNVFGIRECVAGCGFMCSVSKFWGTAYSGG